MFGEINGKQLDVAEVFFIDPAAKISIRELARRSGVSTAWVSETVGELVEENILAVDTSKASKTVSAGGDAFNTVKRLYNLTQLFEHGLVNFLEDELRPDALIVFGSYEKGEDRKDSDIDIAVVNGREKEVALTRFEDQLHRSIELHYIENAEKGDAAFRNSVANGFVLTGFYKVVS